jgi:DNA invertase Pin-like site-specific DNA recombinase
MKYRAPHETATEIRAAKWSGKSLTDLEAEFDISRSTPVRYTRDVTARAKARRDVQYDHGNVLKLLEQGLSQTIISERLGISRALIYRICKRTYGVDPSELPAHRARMEWKAAA